MEAVKRLLALTALLSVAHEMDEEFHFPFSVSHLRFVIAPVAPAIAQCSLDIDSGPLRAMANDKSQMTNGKCSSYLIS
jgi:hypothetical protein